MRKESGRQYLATILTINEQDPMNQRREEVYKTDTL